MDEIYTRKLFSQDDLKSSDIFLRKLNENLVIDARHRHDGIDSVRISGGRGEPTEEPTEEPRPDPVRVETIKIIASDDSWVMDQERLEWSFLFSTSFPASSFSFWFQNENQKKEAFYPGVSAVSAQQFKIWTLEKLNIIVYVR